MKLLYSDSFLAVCVKPAGLESEQEMPDLLAQELGGSFYPVHRLDRNVGGVMVYGRNKEAAAFLNAAIQAGQLQKEYRAVCHGQPTEEGTLRDLLFKDSRFGKVYTVKRMRKGVREAELSYRVLARHEDTSLLEIHLKTGRSHQIRVQFASRGYPLLGDRKYGARDSFSAPALWSYSLTFPHPKGDTLTFSCPPAGDVWDPFSL